MSKDEKMYEAMTKKYERCITYDFILQYRRKFDTQTNEEMNNSIASYAQKGLQFSGTWSLVTRVMIAAGIQLVGYHSFWSSVVHALESPVAPQFELAQLKRHKIHVMKLCCEKNSKSRRRGTGDIMIDLRMNW